MDALIVEAERLTKDFGPVRALDGLTLTIAEGGIFALLGPNGAGKTTLIRVLATLVRPDAGTARVAGVDVRRDPARVRTMIGLAGQYAAIDGYLTGRENIEMTGRLYGLSRRETKARTAEVLERIGLAGVAGRQVKTYSGGMRRRIDLAASLVGRPRVLFLDEPTTGVDPASRRDLWKLISDLADGGTTILLTTQYLEEADHLADRVAVIDHGRVVSQGTPDELKAQTGGAVLELSIHDGDRQQALALLGDLSMGIGPVTYDGSRNVIVVPASRGVDTLREALEQLAAAGIRPDDVSLHKPTLDDVFLHLITRTPTSATTEGARA